MAGRSEATFEDTPVRAHVLIVEAPYYQDISEALLAGALAELGARGATYERVQVPGALEIPQVLGQAVAAGLIGEMAADARRFDGMIALGCVIRGETSHYDIVVDNANHWMMDCAMAHAIPVGNAILTTDTHAQAMARAEGGRAGKGGDAARACLSLVALGRRFRERQA